MKKFLTENIMLKFVALLMAVLLKLYFFSADSYVTATIEVPLTIDNVPRSMMLISPIEPAALRTKIKLRGPGPLIEQVKATIDNIKVDLPPLNTNSEAPVSETVRPKKFLNVQAGVEVVEVSPSEVKLSFDRIVKKEILVDPIVVGSVPVGYKLEDIRSQPAAIQAVGPASELRNLNAAKTEEIDISKFINPVRKDVQLIDVSPLVTLSYSIVRVELRVAPVMTERLFSDQSVKVLAPDGYAATLEPSKVNVTLSGPGLSIEALTPMDFELQADGRGLGVGEHQVEVGIKIPPTINNVRMINTEPKKVNIRLVNKNG